MAIRFAGNDHIIEYNHIHHVVLETSDAGAVYIGRDWSMRGNIVRYNYIHHLGDHNLPDPGAVGIYLDDLASGTEVVGNIVYRARRGVLLGGGRDNIIHKNIFAEGHVSVMMDRRGKEWKVDFLHGKNLDFVGRLLDVHYDSPLYQSRYPRLVNILNNDPLEPLGNEIEDNIFLNAPLSLNGAKPLEKNNTNLDLGKPGTPDDQDDASDNSDSPADLIQIAKWAVVQGIPFNKIGLSGGPERKNRSISLRSFKVFATLFPHI
jgi:parallel beta-helix repeat protein